MLHGIKETCTKIESSCPVLPLRSTYKVLVTVQEDVEDTKILPDYINVPLY